MDSNNSTRGQVTGGDAVDVGGTEGGDWRSQLQPEARQRIVNKMMETLKRHVPFSGQEGLQELKKIAVRFEEKIYIAATCQSDYLRKISLIMLTMETKSQNPVSYSLQSNAASNNKTPQDSDSQSMQPQMQNQVLQQQQKQQMGLQQQANTLSRDIQQRIQPSDPMLQQQNTIDQNQLMQTQRVPEVPMTSLDSSSQTRNASGGDWQEEIYQKIKNMNEMYFPELNEMYQRMAAKLQQYDALPQQPKSDQLEKLRFLKLMLERLILFVRTNKNDIQPNHKEKIVGIEKQIINILNSNRLGKPLQQGQLSQAHMHAMQQSQQQQPQISQVHSSDGQMNSQVQAMNAQSSMLTTQQKNLNNMQHNSSVPDPCQNMMDMLQPVSNVNPGQGNALAQMQQVAMSALRQNCVSGTQQMNMNSISSQKGLTRLQSNVNNPLQSHSSILQSQHIKKEQQMFAIQQLIQQNQQLQQMHQQCIERQQLMQQQQMMQQVAMSALQQNCVSGTQQMNMKSISSQNGLTRLQSNVNNPLQSHLSILQSQHIKQEQQQMFAIQQLIQQNQQMHQQCIERQQLMQQQQMMQLNQMNDANDVKMRHQMCVKSGALPLHTSSGQRPPYHLLESFIYFVVLVSFLVLVLLFFLSPLGF